MKLMTWWRLLVVGACLPGVLVSVVLADQQDDYQKKIDVIGNEISRISRNLNANKALLKTEREKLLETERKMVVMMKEIKATNQLIEEHQLRSTKLQDQIQALHQQSAQDRIALTKFLKQRYMHGQENYLKMMLNQQNPYALGRLQNYYYFFSNALQTKQVKLLAHQQQVDQLKREAEQQLHDLANRQAILAKQKTGLSRHKQARDISIKKLNTKVAQSSERLVQLKEDRDRLSRLLKEIAVQAAELERVEQERARQLTTPQAGQPGKSQKRAAKRVLLEAGFSRQQGRLQPPVQGRQKYHYGSRLAESGMLADGVFIDTEGSVPVRSIYQGRVLFADFLKGYGLLLIIDHGDDHISLYGHNELLYKKVGDMVEINETVAKTGVSGGLLSHGLYFEIRENTNPVDPAKWCQF